MVFANVASFSSTPLVLATKYPNSQSINGSKDDARAICDLVKNPLVIISLQYPRFNLIKWAPSLLLARFLACFLPYLAKPSSLLSHIPTCLFSSILISRFFCNYVSRSLILSHC